MMTLKRPDDHFIMSGHYKTGLVVGFIRSTFVTLGCRSIFIIATLALLQSSVAGNVYYVAGYAFFVATMKIVATNFHEKALLQQNEKLLQQNSKNFSLLQQNFFLKKFFGRQAMEYISYTYPIVYCIYNIQCKYIVYTIHCKYNIIYYSIVYPILIYIIKNRYGILYSIQYTDF